MKNMGKSDIDTIISKVLQGNANKKEQDRFNDWLETDETNKEIFKQLRIEWNHKTRQKRAVNEDELIDKIWNRYDKGSRKSSDNKAIKLLPLFIKSAAAVLVLVTFTFLYNSNESALQAEKDPYEIVVKENKGGQKSKIYLTDGSVVWLNSNSSLTYTKPFKEDVREVHLSGEAYFEVAPDSLKPFVVKFSGSSVKVLGTSFNISAYKEDRKIVVSLREGKISVKHEDQSQILTLGWIAEISQKTNTIESYQGDVSANLAWTRDELLFKNATYSEIFPKLERWYGMEILVRGKYDSHMKFTGTFKNEYLNNVLEHLKADDNMRYEIVQEKVIVSFN